MMRRVLHWTGRLVVDHPGLVVVVSLGLSLLLYSNIHNLRTGTDLTEMFGGNDPQWKAASEIGKELGYGNQLFVIIEAPPGDADKSAEMEQMADRLTDEMAASGLFKHERSGLQQDELLNMVKLYTWNFPSFVQQDQVPAFRDKLEPQHIRNNVRQAASELVTPFSSMGADYFVADPLGLMSIPAQSGQGISQLANFDLNYGSGNRFFSKDHKALLILAEPRDSAVDYKFAGSVVAWTRDHIRAAMADPAFAQTGVKATQAGTYVFAEEDHRFIDRNIRLVSTISLIGNLILCLLVYPRIPMLLLSLIPAGLGILCTTGIASYYPGEVNLISLSFIAILGGLGDDQIVHFFNRTPQEWSKGGTYNQALLRTYETTGVSIVLCIVTAATATTALAFSGFKALAEFGFILTVGMFMMMFHTLLTVPALLQLWGKIFKPVAPRAITFRFLPSLAHKLVDAVGRRARAVVIGAATLFALSLLLLPFVKLSGHFEISESANDPAMVAQALLSAKFGIEGNPNLLLIAGTEEEVLRRAEQISAGLETYERRGVIQSVFSPTSLIPSQQTQAERRRLLADVDFGASSRALETSLVAAGMQISPHQAYVERLQQLARGAPYVTIASAQSFLPEGLLDNSLRRTSDGNYVAAIAYYPVDANVAQRIPDAVLQSWRARYGPFVDFSFDKINRDMQTQLLQDSRRALVWTAAGILLIVYVTFRSLRMSLLVLMPIGFSIIVTFGLLRLVGHTFSFMSITAIPLIIGIGIDNGIHLVRRYREVDGADILVVAKDSGAALIQSNLTTIIGFGALLASTFTPLRELGLVTSMGVVLSLIGGLCVIPAVIVLSKRRRDLKLASLSVDG